MRWLTISSICSSLAVPWLAVGTATAQTVTFRPPEDIINTAGCGDWTSAVSETDVAVGKSDVMAVWRNGNKDIGFAIRSSALPAGTWSCPELIPKTFNTHGMCFTPTGTFEALSYPSVAYSPATAENPECFMASALAKFVAPSGDRHWCVVVSYYEPGALNPAWKPWMVLDMKTETCFGEICSINHFDKPVITAGAPDEFYVVYIDHLGLGLYSHTTNGGRQPPAGPTSAVGDWICGDYIRDAQGDQVGIGFGIQAAALDGSDDLFCMYFSSVASGIRYGFVRGFDQTDTTVQFDHPIGPEPLCCPGLGPQPLTIDYNHEPWEVSDLLPGNPNAPYEPQIAVEKIGIEPEHYYQLYVIANDSPLTTGSNVDTYLNVAVETPGATPPWNWMHAGHGVLLDDDPQQGIDGCNENPVYEGITDTWLPMLAVDKQGRAHSISYDDRVFFQRDGSPAAGCESPRWNLNYSVTVDQGFTSTDHPQPAPAGESAWLDYSFSPYNGPRGYNGLDFTTKQGVVYMWATVSGTSAVGPPKNSVIWAQLIIVQ